MLSTKAKRNRSLRNHWYWDELRGTDPMATAPQIPRQQPARPGLGFEWRLKPIHLAVHKRCRVEIL
jgi:hypothetical protein